MAETLIFRLRKRAEIRRQIPSRKSVQEGQPDRIADLLEEAARELEIVNKELDNAHKLLDTYGVPRDCNDSWVSVPWTLYARIELLKRSSP